MRLVTREYGEYIGWSDDSHCYHSTFLSSYNLLCEDDPDDFVTLEIPADSMTTDSDAPPLERDMRRKGGFLDNLRKNRNSAGAGITVITGKKRIMGRGGGAKGGVRDSDGAAAVALHDLGDEPRVLQEDIVARHPEAADRVGELSSGKERNRGVFEPAAENHCSSLDVSLVHAQNIQTKISKPMSKCI